MNMLIDPYYLFGFAAGFLDALVVAFVAVRYRRRKAPAYAPTHSARHRR